ncbi:MAG: hypothetical protein P8M49_14250 [Thalassotalea sp.]|nr:hypothetical protein [Thalassotalea sp.]MDG2394672.1 hypothetical protein [Thalassotalea sp.]
MTRYKKSSFLLNSTNSAIKSNSMKNMSLSLVLVATMLSMPALAEQVSDKEEYIIKSCNSYKEGADETKTLACGIYIRGFFYGVLNSGNTDVLKIEKNSKSSSSFVERAYANRVGRKPERKPLAGSCLTVEQLKEKIVNNLSDASLATFGSINQVNTFLINTLTAACSPEN